MVDLAEIRDALMNVYDPELRINIVDLGLVYDIKAIDDAKIKVIMTFTAPNCPVSEQILNDVKTMVLSVDEVKGVEVEITWEPPWTKEMISEEGRLMMAFDA
jgi:metal-sulfur cluster biosynthetic enzyme